MIIDFHKNPLFRSFAFGSALVSIAGCQATSGGANVSADPAEIELVNELFSTSCVHTRTQGSNQSQSKINDSFTIMSIADRPNGWRAVDIAYGGFRDNFYFNTTTGEVICGGTSWNNYRAGTFEPPKHPKITKQTETRSIAVQWDGFAELFSGTIKETQDGASGIVTIILPNNTGQCDGNYKMTERTTGTWKINCSNGLAADGTFTAFGDGKGASGIGKDSQGRKVTYTMGGRT